MCLLVTDIIVFGIYIICVAYGKWSTSKFTAKIQIKKEPKLKVDTSKPHIASKRHCNKIAKLIAICIW